MQIYLTKKERFNAAYQIYREDWTPAKNLAIFGKCASPNYHGHNCTAYITERKTVTPANASLPYPKKFDEIVKTEIIEQLDHKNLNLNVDFMKGKMATTEVLCIAIFEKLHPLINSEGFALHAIKLQETEQNSVEYFEP